MFPKVEPESCPSAIAGCGAADGTRSVPATILRPLVKIPTGKETRPYDEPHRRGTRCGRVPAIYQLLAAIPTVCDDCDSLPSIGQTSVFARFRMPQFFSLRVALVVVFALALPLATGCDSSTPKKTSSSSKPSKPKPKPPEPKKPVDPKAFSSVDEAIAAIVKGHEAQDQKLTDLARDWLVWKGPSIEPQIKAQLQDPSANLAVRLQSCYILAQMGSVAIPTLKAATAPDTKPDQVRTQAITCMAMIKPPNKEMIDHMVVLAWDKDARIRTAGLNGIKRIGPPVKEADPAIVEKLMGVLNSQTEEDQFRNLAKLALKAVEPRHGFGGMGKVDKK